MSTTAEKIAVMQAYERGEQIEHKDISGNWIPSQPVWSWNDTEYRVKPKPVEYWAVAGSRQQPYAAGCEEQAKCLASDWNERKLHDYPHRAILMREVTP